MKRGINLDAAISHAEDVAATSCDACQADHMQLAAWLRELRDLRRILGVISPPDKLDLANRYMAAGKITDAEWRLFMGLDR